ncbi:MAG: GNAT family N-acetyltransferase [Sphingobium sp.]|uniref:GNAT family N-acetyltransferase n=1 Tax=Sphingobium sp. TaxID=1912891 RepID=UPI003BAF2A78
MRKGTESAPYDPSLVEAWLTARSIARGLPPPVGDHGGWRVDTAQPSEAKRYVFAKVTEGLEQLARSIDSPLVVLKLCGSESMMRAAVSSRWQIRQEGWFMTFQREADAPSVVPPGYELNLCVEGAVIVARIFTRDGTLAASGYAAGAEGVFVYDRIITEESHRRMGLGSAVVNALASRRYPADARQALVATHEGRALYTRLGWMVQSPWTTAIIPEV